MIGIRTLEVFVDPVSRTTPANDSVWDRLGGVPSFIGTEGCHWLQYIENKDNAEYISSDFLIGRLQKDLGVLWKKWNVTADCARFGV